MFDGLGTETSGLANKVGWSFSRLPTQALCVVHLNQPKVCSCRFLRVQEYLTRCTTRRRQREWATLCQQVEPHHEVGGLLGCPEMVPRWFVANLSDVQRNFSAWSSLLNAVMQAIQVAPPSFQVCSLHSTSGMGGWKTIQIIEAEFHELAVPFGWVVDETPPALPWHLGPLL